MLGIIRWRWTASTGPQRQLLFLWIAALAVLAFQLLPLPAVFFAKLPERAAVLSDLHIARIEPAWLPMSLDPWGTVRALLAVVTFGAVWLLACTLRSGTRLRLLKLAVIVAVPMVLLGFVQAVSVRTNLTFHPFQHVGMATGTFANRNHFASLLSMLAPVAILFGYQAQRARDMVTAVAWYGTLVLLLLGAALTFSRAGGVLASVAAVLTTLLVLRETKARNLIALLATAGITILVVGNYAWNRIAMRFAADPLVDQRWTYLEHGSAAAKAFWPFGSGAGTFRDIYATFEPVTDMGSTYALHAHNDVLEIAIELGFPGLLLVALLLAMLIMRSRRALAGNVLSTPVIALAAWVPLIHSLVDYPLRTLAVTVLFALMLAHLDNPNARRSVQQGERNPKREVRVRRLRAQPALTQADSLMRSPSVDRSLFEPLRTQNSNEWEVPEWGDGGVMSANPGRRA